MDERILQIVIRARDEASRVLKEASANVDSLGESFKKNIGTAGIMAGGLVGGMGLLAKSFVDNAAAMEQNRVAFTTFLGNAEKAGQLLAKLSEEARTTPFDLPQVVDGAKRLLAYGVAADEVIPTFRMLGNVSAGNKERLNQLTLAYGQVKAATRLTGAELRQFTEAGVPMLQALADQFNKTGGKVIQMGGAAKKTKVDVNELNQKLAITKQQLLEAEGSAKTKQSRLMSLRNTIENYEQKIASATQTTGGFSKQVKVTAGDVKDMIEDGKVSFEDVQKALSGMTEKGGRFYNLMDDQAKTFAGRMSNLRDEFIRFSLAVVGMTDNGEVRKGSIFYYISEGAKLALKIVSDFRPVVQQFVDAFLSNQQAVSAAIGGLIGLFVLMGVAFLGAFGPALLVMTTFVLVGAGVGFLINELVMQFGGWNTVLGTLNSVLQSAIGFVNQHKDQLATVATILGVSLLPALAQTAIKMGVDFALSVGKATLSLITWIAEGWKTIAVLMIKIVQLGIAIGMFVIHAVVVGASAIATGVLTAATWLLNAALFILTSPITLVILAIIALIAIGVLLWKNWDTVKAKAAEVWANVTTAWNGLMKNVNQAIQGMMNKVNEWKEGISDAVNSIIGFFKRMADGIMGALRSIKFPRLSIGSGSVSVMGKKIEYPTINVDWYKKGGFVPRTGLAMVHEGEYVLSKDMLSGRQPANTPVSGIGSNIVIGPVYVQEVGDIDTMAQRLSFYMKTSGNL